MFFDSKLCVLVYFGFVMVTGSQEVNNEEIVINEGTSTPDPRDHEATPILDALEDSVIRSILKLVDVKFESISSRLGSLERTISTHQYNTYQHFRLMNNYLKVLEDRSEHQYKSSAEDRMTIKGAIENVKTEVKSMEKLQIDSRTSQNSELSDLETRLTVRLDIMQHSMGELMNFSQGRRSEMETTQSRLLSDQILNVTDKLDSIGNKLESVQKDNISSVLTAFGDTLGKVQLNGEKSDRFLTLERKLDDYKQQQNEIFHNITRSFTMRQTTAHNESSAERQLLFHTLSELNDNVLKSTDFYRHTGDLIERIVGATETVSEDQDVIRNDLRLFLEIQTNMTKSLPKEDEFDNNDIPNDIQAVSSPCQISLAEITKMASALHNTSDTANVISELAQLASTTLKNSVTEIKETVNDVKDVADNIRLTAISLENNKATPEVRIPSQPCPPEVDHESLLNTTKSVFQIVEAVASNTGWIPYIFHNLQSLELQANKTLYHTHRVVSIVSHINKTVTDVVRDRDNWPLNDGPVGLRKLSTTRRPTVVPSTTTRATTAATTTPTQASILADVGSEVMWSYNDTFALSNKINFIYRTSSKMHRLIPALTRLLGEPGRKTL